MIAITRKQVPIIVTDINTQIYISSINSTNNINLKSSHNIVYVSYIIVLAIANANSINQTHKTHLNQEH